MFCFVIKIPIYWHKLCTTLFCVRSGRTIYLFFKKLKSIQIIPFYSKIFLIIIFLFNLIRRALVIVDFFLQLQILPQPRPISTQNPNCVTPWQSSLVEHFVYLAHLSEGSGLPWTRPRKVIRRTIRERNFILAPEGGRKRGGAEGRRRFIWC